MDKRFKVTQKEDGAVISVAGYDIIITVKPTEEVAPKLTVEFVMAKLEGYLDELEVSEEAEGIVVRPKGFLGRDRFASIAAIVKEMDGRYISAGRESRFLISKE